MRKYHYEYFVYTNNLKWGKIYLGQDKNESKAHSIGRTAGKGCYIVKRQRVYN